MKQSAPVPKKSPAAMVFFVVFLALFAASAAGVVVFVKLNRTVRLTTGKIVDSYTKKEFASRKQTYDQEYDVVKYAVDGREYTGKTAKPKTGYSSQYVTTYYYPKFPGNAWFFKKSNPGVFYSSLVAVLSLGALLISLSGMVKKTAVAVQPQVQAKNPGKK
jgi:hypothetical protein